MPPTTHPPAAYDDLQALIISRHGEMPKRLAQVAEFASASPEEIALGPVTRIAELAGVQPSTLVRFAQYLGYAGFSDFQEVFRVRIRGNRPTYGDRLAALRDEAADGTEALLAGFCTAAIDSILDVRNNADPARLDEAARLLAAADTIYLMGQRRAFPAASYLAYMFGQLVIRHQLAANIGTMAPDQLGLARPGDAVLAISFTPYTPTTVDAAASAFDRGVPVVAITDSPFSPLAAKSNVWLEVSETDHASFRSVAATFCVAMTLAIATAEQRDANEKKRNKKSS